MNWRRSYKCADCGGVGYSNSNRSIRCRSCQTVKDKQVNRDAATTFRYKRDGDDFVRGEKGICQVCGESFARYSRRHVCCSNQCIRKAIYYRNFAKYQLKGKKRYQKLSKEERRKRWTLHRQRHPEKSRARNLLAAAKKRGEIIAQSCEVCGEKKVHAHHYDYNKPLDVMWLCSKHHGEWHRNHKVIEPISPQENPNNVK